MSVAYLFMPVTCHILSLGENVTYYNIMLALAFEYYVGKIQGGSRLFHLLV